MCVVTACLPFDPAVEEMVCFFDGSVGRPSSEGARERTNELGGRRRIEVRPATFGLPADRSCETANF